MKNAMKALVFVLCSVSAVSQAYTVFGHKPAGLEITLKALYITDTVSSICGPKAIEIG